MNNRYICCKAKRKDNGEWVTGYYLCLNGNQHRIYTGYAEVDCGEYYPDYHEVVADTVKQCTTGKIEAIKEFAERLKKVISDERFSRYGLEHDIDRIAKEMTEVQR